MAMNAQDREAMRLADESARITQMGNAAAEVLAARARLETVTQEAIVAGIKLEEGHDRGIWPGEPEDAVALVDRLEEAKADYGVALGRYKDARREDG